MKRGSQKQAPSGLLSKQASLPIGREPQTEVTRNWENTLATMNTGCAGKQAQGKARVKVKERSEITKNRIKGEMRREH